MRAVAALMVFGSHLRLLHVLEPARVFRDGYTGVTFFFILSGMVLAWSQPEDGRARTFWWRRFVRVWPATAVAVIFAWLAFGAPIGSKALLALGINLALLQPWSTDALYVFSPNGQTWSLGCEAFFYAGFPLLVYVLRRLDSHPRIALTAAWGLATMGASLLPLWFHDRTFGLITYVNPVVRSGEFVLGVALALELQRRGPWRVQVWHGAAALVIAELLIWAGLPARTATSLLTPGFLLLLAAGASADLTGRSRLLQWRWAQYAGQLSFAFYLVHATVLVYLVRHYPQQGVVRGAGLAAVGLVLATAVAALLHHGVELPVQRRLVGRPAVSSGPA
ncbi:MAG TPA: acyltransferase [Nonomuraea sp.]|nr:acyltransferase [Nonomuraea sp.]